MSVQKKKNKEILFCEVCGLNHFDDDPLCDPATWRYGKIAFEADGTLGFEPPGDRTDCRSRNAIAAEEEGKLPLSVAIPIVAHHGQCTKKKAEAALRESYEGEWHHVGLSFKPVRYYSIARAVALLRYGDAGKAK